MSVVVRMEMPTNCAKCDLHYRCAESRGIYGFDAIREMMRLDTVNDKREDEHCLFVCSLPEGHGRLVDMRDIEQMEASALDKQDEYFVGWNDAIKICQTVPTIVPTERSETEQV